MMPESCPFIFTVQFPAPPDIFPFSGYYWAINTQSPSSSRSNPVNSSSLSHGNVFLIAAYAHAGKGILLFPKNP